MSEAVKINRLKMLKTFSESDESINELSESAVQYKLFAANKETFRIADSETPKFTFIDLFAGIGGFHLAMSAAGGQCVFASEIDKYARETYIENFYESSLLVFENGFFNNDITDKNLDYSKIPDFDILCAGFPCQPFSYAGLKKGFADTRGTLFFNIEEIVKTKILIQKKPKVLFLENVKGLVSHDKGRTFAAIKQSLNDLDYEVFSKVLNSKNFGVPQNRERIYIVAVDKNYSKSQFRFPIGISEFNDIIFDGDNNCNYKKTLIRDILLKDEVLLKLEQEENRTYTISQRMWDGHQLRKEMHRKKGNGFGYSLYKPDDPYTSTISARYWKDGSEILIDQSHLGKRPRLLHPVEAAWLQGYHAHWNGKPDKFHFPVSRKETYRQLGNSVTVDVVKIVSSEIVKQLLK